MSSPIAFLDESGDVGLKPGDGSSLLFVMALVVFVDRTESDRCIDRITRLRVDLGKPARHEFHFRRDGDNTRRSFLTAVASFDSTYYVSVVEKNQLRSTDADVLFNTAVGRVFDSANQVLRNATVIVDGSGDRRYRQRLGAVVRSHAGSASGASRVTEIKVQRSETNNGIQLADYIAGIIHRRAQQKRGADDYHSLIARHEGAVTFWSL